MYRKDEFRRIIEEIKARPYDSTPPLETPPDEFLQAFGDSAIEIYDGILNLVSFGHAGAVLVNTARVDEQLQKALMSEMRPLSSRLRERLFDGYGPLGSLSAKMDLAFALELIDEQTFQDLRIVKDIRNAIAHSADHHTLNSPEMLKLLGKLHGWSEQEDPFSFFKNKISHCLRQIREESQRRASERRAHSETPQPSPDKS